MSYILHKSVATYFDALMHFNLKEDDVSNLTRKGNIVIISTKDRLYLKSIIHNEQNINSQEEDRI